jgi:hypothetical protein
LGDKNFRQDYLKHRWAMMQAHESSHYHPGFAWLSAEKHLQELVNNNKDYQRQYFNELIQSISIKTQIINGILFWRADVCYSNHRQAPKHEVTMLSDNGINLSFESDPTVEKMVASLHEYAHNSQLPFRK